MADGDQSPSASSPVSTQEHPVIRPGADREAADAAHGGRRRGRSSAGPDAEASPRRRRRTASQRTVLSAGVIALGVVLLVAAVVVYGAVKLSNIGRSAVQVDPVAADKPQNFLVVGSDSRDNIKRDDPDSGAFLGGGNEPTGKRSDTIMIVRIDPANEQMDLLSLPRDLWVPIAGGGTERINTAYTGETPQRLIDTIRQDLGIEINHYVEIDFKGFKGIVEAVGGVPMYFDRPMRDTNSGLQVTRAGCQRLDGVQALAFARARHLQYQDKNGLWKDDPTGDLGRISRQQYFIKVTLAQASHTVVSPDLRAGNQVVDALVDNVTVDRNLDVAGMAPLARRLASLPPDKVRTYSLPVTPYTTGGGGAVVRMSASQAQPILNTFRGLSPDAVPPSAVKFDVVHGTGLSARAASARDELAPLGFAAGTLSEAGSPVKRTAIRYPAGEDLLAATLAAHVQPTPDLVETKGLKDNRMQLVIGSDFASVSVDAHPVARPGTGFGNPAPGSSPGSAAGGGTGASSTATTAAVLGGTEVVGVVPGQPPAGVNCSA